MNAKVKVANQAPPPQEADVAAWREAVEEELLL